MSNGADAPGAGFERGLDGRHCRAPGFSRAKVTTSTELAVATPRLMIAPIKAGTLSVVWHRNNAQTTPGERGGAGRWMMMNGSSQFWKLMTSRK